MLGFGLGWLEGTGEEGALDVSQGLGHLRVRHLLVEYNSLDELGVLKPSSGLQWAKRIAKRVRINGEARSEAKS